MDSLPMKGKEKEKWGKPDQWIGEAVAIHRNETWEGT
jgi:hypothetical protein